jgi:hypothetical protein
MFNSDPRFVMVMQILGSTMWKINAGSVYFNLLKNYWNPWEVFEINKSNRIKEKNAYEIIGTDI